MSETMTKPAATPKALSMIAPNLYNLSGGGVHVTYSTTGVAGRLADGLTALGRFQYSNAAFQAGSGAIDVDGIRPDGSAEPLMRSGEWV